MSKLEDLWDELSTGKPRVDAILGAGRADAARRRTLTRSAIAVGGAAALVGAFVAGGAVSNNPGSPADTASDIRPVAFQADLKPAQSCDQLLESYKDRALGIVTAWGWQQQSVMYTAQRDSLENLAVQPTRAQRASDTGTNVQETGVDEPDTVKTNGKLVVRVRGSRLVVYDVTGAEVVQRATINLPQLESGEILLTGTSVVAIGADGSSARDEMTGARRASRIITVSIAEPDRPTIESTVTYDSRVLSARQHGSTVRVILSAGLPDFDFVQPDGKVTQKEALAANRKLIDDSTIKDWLTSYNVGKGDKTLLDCTNVAIPPSSPGLDTVSIVGFAAEAPTKPHAIGLAASTTTAYESAGHLYLADGPTPWDCRMCFVRDRVIAPQSGGTAHLYDFKLDGLDAIHIASGEVEGTIADRWSMDEADDVLRVAVGPSSETGNFNSVVTFRREGTELAEIGRLDKLGRNEDLKGVRWFDDLAVLVTFREVDPLYTIDLEDSAKPRLIGKLKIPGYSDYLHPLSDGQMLGIGYDRSAVQIALFDTSDLADVRRTAVELYPRASAVATEDPRAFTWLPEQKTALTVIQKGDRVKLVALKVTGGKLTSTQTDVEYGSDAGQVRTMGMPDGRVILVTGEDVRFFDLKA